ncbi:ImuA family protein [Aureimonas psammosilenae]|uniref:ImuA family protein n=1 Tax=Aureimonas psammosilenae TaxID=2495496 RepID=UPI0012609924|nr:hypothetical protein [Aureimonas psammosilenae]
MASSSSADKAKPKRAPPADLIASLRAAVARIEGAPARLVLPETPTEAEGPAPARPVAARRAPSASATLEAALKPGLAEIHGSETRGMGAATGFVLALGVLAAARPSRPLLWIGTGLGFGEAGRLYAPGLLAAGLDPAALLCVRARCLADAVWAAEEAARSGLPALTVLEARGNPAMLALEGTRRLHLRGRDGGAPVVLLRQSGQPESTAAPLRLRIAPGPSRPPPDLASPSSFVGRPAFALDVEKHRGTPVYRLLLEWNAHDRRFESGTGPADADARHPFRLSRDGSAPAARNRDVVALGNAR